ncbi:unnamed protein product [Leptidea sinapis]|uniref:Uncharacterized protein n=1 Tax=Leptidea sinapis TaxID=189913 RepID=A0A5E4QQ94_9NEOP|nr:unnamed protein product [Leptidea sinapis]
MVQDSPCPRTLDCPALLWVSTVRRIHQQTRTLIQALALTAQHFIHL